jgi:tetratricopeptide (TPR) repeat protein
MRYLLASILPLVLLACSTPPPQQHTLRDVDVVGGKSATAQTATSLRNEAAIREAYAEYLKHASKQDISRIDALQRLAQLEFQLIDRLARNNGEHSEGTLKLEDSLHNAALDRSIEFLEISLRDYPNAANNDKSLYHLARAYDQKGEYDKSIATLKKLVSKHPKSDYYVEGQFRLAEAAFSRGEYGMAEDIYTEVIVSRDNQVFRQNARYKRGWARYKQEYYHQAVDDFVEVVNESGFKPYDTLGDSAKNQFDEYFRALGLSFSYMGGAAALTDYFAGKPDFAYIFETYTHVSDIFLKQQRYSDAAGIFEKFAHNHPSSPHVPDAELRIVGIWKDSGFTAMAINSLEGFYTRYHPQHNYWAEGKRDPQLYTKVAAALRDNIVLAASHFHREFNKSGKQASFEQARVWYERYLRDYKAYARKDNIHYLYAELLQQNKQYAQALQHYELAAYDADIILNKDAAYASILLATRLHRDAKAEPDKRAHLDKLVHYSLLYTRLYPHDKHSMQIITHAAQESYLAGNYAQTISLIEQSSDLPYTTATYNIHVIKAHAYFRQADYSAAETAYTSVITQYPRKDASARQIRDNLAIAIYNQGGAAQKQNDTVSAIGHYVRITDVVPESEVAATGLYDAIVLAASHEMWDDVIQYIRTFQRHYPSHKHSKEVSKQLSVAYLKSDREIEAASELVKLSRSEQDGEYKIAALWKAAELYESNKDYPAARRAFTEYAKSHPRPYPQYMEAMHKLVGLTTQTSNAQDADKWRQAVLKADKRTPADLKTERTRFIASTAALELARAQHQRFTAVRLTAPLKQNLARKKKAMQEAVNLYGQASAYRVSDTATEAVHAIGDIYRGFSKALLESERPKNLDPVELEQYNVLLEDQAFPFEEKAIEFYETNLTHVKDGVFDSWIQQSQTRLAELFPARFGRELKLEGYINVLH